MRLTGDFPSTLVSNWIERTLGVVLVGMCLVGVGMTVRYASRLFLNDGGTFVDIETGHATELPWESDSAVSWQRVPIE